MSARLSLHTAYGAGAAEAIRVTLQAVCAAGLGHIAAATLHYGRYLWLTCVLLSFSSQTGIAQQSASLSGFVTDAETGASLIAANIFIEDLLRGASANTSGYYAIANLPAGHIRVRCTYVSYQASYSELVLVEGEQHRLDISLDSVTDTFTEVVVEAGQAVENEALGVAVLDAETVTGQPAVLEPDVFRSLQLLPGVTAASDYSSALHVRGGDAGQTSVMWDGAKVYSPGHVFGLFSRFNPDAVKNATLYRGGFPASYGGSLGSALDIRSKDGNRHETHGILVLGTLASRVLVEGPHFQGSYVFAARRSTLGPLLKAFSHIDAIPDRLYFHDLNGKVTFDLSSDDILSFSAYGGEDLLKLTVWGDNQIDLRYGNVLLAGTWMHLFTDRFLANLTAATSAYSSTSRALVASTEIRQENRIYDTSFRGDFYYYSGASSWEFGFWVGQSLAPLRKFWTGIPRISWRRKARFASVYLQDTIKPAHNWEFKVGVRGSYWEDGRHFRAAPRFFIEHGRGGRVRLQAAAGRYYQFLTLVADGTITGFDYWLSSAEGVPPAYGDQYILGAKVALGAGWTLAAESYYRTMRNLFRPDPFFGDAIDAEYAELFLFGEGWARGIEVLLQRSRGRLHGFLAYTLSRTERTFPTINTNTLGAPKAYSPRHDRLHNFNVVLSCNLGRQWTITAVFAYATGQPYTNPLARYTFKENNWVDGAGSVWVLVSPSLNAARLPAYHRLDAGIRKAGKIGDFANYMLQVQVVNAYEKQNPWVVLYGQQWGGELVRTEVPQIPVPLPSFSLSLEL